MKAVTKITFYDDQDNKFFGEGPCRLLHAVEGDRLPAGGGAVDGDGIHQGHEIAEDRREITGMLADDTDGGRTGRRRQSADRAGKGVAGPL